MNRVCVFCGSAAGVRETYAEAAQAVGRLLAEQGVELVYGGGDVGLMGILADACMAAGGTVIGVIPRFLMAREVGHEGVSILHIVESMHERKAMMADLSDAFLALPGGIGTMEELFEVWTWSQLGEHAKPVGLLDVQGYYGPLVGFIDHMVEEGFLRLEHRELLLVGQEAGAIVEALGSWQPHEGAGVLKWDER